MSQKVDPYKHDRPESFAPPIRQRERVRAINSMQYTLNILSLGRLTPMAMVIANTRNLNVMHPTHIILFPQVPTSFFRMNMAMKSKGILIFHGLPTTLDGKQSQSISELVILAEDAQKDATERLHSSYRMNMVVKSIGGLLVSIIFFYGAEILYHSTPGYGSSSYGKASSRVSYMDHYGRSAFLLHYNLLPPSCRADEVTCGYGFLQQSGFRNVSITSWFSQCGTNRT